MRPPWVFCLWHEDPEFSSFFAWDIRITQVQVENIDYKHLCAMLGLRADGIRFNGNMDEG